MNLTRPIESQLEMARDLACEMTTCANALDLEQKLSFYWSARQIVTCGRLYLNDLRLATADHLISEGVPPDEAAKRSGFTSRSNYYQQRRNRRKKVQQ